MTIVELERTARAIVPPVGATGIVATVELERCGRLANGSPSGVILEGGRARAPRTTYGVAWLVDGRIRTAPVVTLEHGRDAYRLIDLLTGRSTSRSAPSLDARPHRGSSRQGAEPAADTADPDLIPAVAVDPGDPSLPDGANHAAVPPGPAAGVGSVPEPITAGHCKACGQALVAPASGQTRQTCDDACRQAYRRGRRAPAVTAGVVDADVAERLSRLPRAPRAARPDPEEQLALEAIAGS